MLNASIERVQLCSIGVNKGLFGFITGSHQRAWRFDSHGRTYLIFPLHLPDLSCCGSSCNWQICWSYPLSSFVSADAAVPRRSMATTLLVANADPQYSPQANRLTAAQSLALMKIFVNASIANICWARELLPYHSSCFQSRFMNDLRNWQQENGGYESFRDSRFSHKPGHSQEFKILAKSENSNSNQVLKLLVSSPPGRICMYVETDVCRSSEFSTRSSEAT